MKVTQADKKLIIKIIAALYLNLFAALIFSEFLNSFFNNKYDLLGISLMDRFHFAFKPAVMLMAFVFTTILCYRVLHYLKPLFRFRYSKEDYDMARVVAIRIPWMIINFEVIIWILATTIYYALKGWEVESGIPFVFGLSLKVVTGFLSALYVAFTINLLLKEAKLELHIVDIRERENDIFSRHKDIIAVFASSLYLVVTLSYISYYYSQHSSRITLESFLLIIIPFVIILFVISVVPLFLSKQEYRFQINTLMCKLKNLAEQRNSLSDKIYLINFDELGEMSLYVNQVLKKFNSFISQIIGVVDQLSKSSISLSSVGEETLSVSNKQTASVAEITSTMEDSDSLSKSIGELAKDVLEKSLRTREYVTEGNETIDEYISSSESVQTANMNTIEFIRTLNDDIKAIWEVVTIINTIAEQVKIIAFNAELEASAAGEAGKNFEIVASEIRRLADNTVISTDEIRNKISVIEKAGKSLLTASNEATKLIYHGLTISKRAGTLFNQILLSSEETTASSESIDEKIRIQIQGFEQIVLAMKQISEGASEFTDSIQTSSITAVDLANLVESLKILVDSGQGREES
ncbi:MAG: methyl-accepting chemotaxis protein [Spirochaetes bacterium]|jgi:methyl-accepting chemotaxis protein|nr:methyl-accepting chemotaxis protein [Spirochaetota bacterium]